MAIETNIRPTQCDRVYRYIQDFGSITQYEALTDLGVMRLASRISEIKKRGAKIKKTMKTVKNRYGEKCSVAEYSLDAEKGENIR